MGTPFDFLDLFNSAVVQLVFRIFRMLAILGFAVAIGGVAIALQHVSWDDPGSWPTPLKVLEEIRQELDSLEDALVWVFVGAGSYILSFVACLRSWWIIPLALAGFLVQVLWMVRAMSEEDEEPWLLASVVPVVAWQIFAAFIEWYHDRQLIVPVAFLLSFTVCWVAAFMVSGWMRRRDLSLWEFIDIHGHRFDPAFYRWRTVAQATPPAPAVNPEPPPTLR